MLGVDIGGVVGRGRQRLDWRKVVGLMLLPLLCEDVLDRPC